MDAIYWWKWGVRRATRPLGVASVCLALAGVAHAENALTLLPGQPGEAMRLRQSVEPNQVLQVEASENLKDWREIGRGHGGLIAYPDFLSVAAPQRFYRSQWHELTAADDGKNQALWEADDFLSDPSGYLDPEPRWIKFAIALNETNKVWFQNSLKYVFHYDFATRRLPEFAGLTRAEFDAASLRLAGQRVVLGAVLFPPSETIREVGVQLVGLDAYPKEQVAGWLDLLKNVLVLPPDVTVQYFPVYEQSPAAAGYRDYLQGRGYSVGSVARWLTANQVYSDGWAMGRLVFVPAAEITQAYTDGRLQATDILVTDAIPAEIPPVAGIIALAPATPNSHVAILARSFEIPFVFLASAADQRRLLANTNRRVVLRAFDNNGYFTTVSVTPTEGISEALAAEILALKVPAKVAFTPKTAAGKISLSTLNLVPADIRYVGGKAAHYGILMRSVPSNCAPAIAFTFDLWDAFLDQTVGGSNTLRQVIQDRLRTHAYPPEMSRLRADLEYIRELFTETADFTAEQKSAIRAALAGFDPRRKIRFRSSTNMEDSDTFTGAGLYDSFSGCLADNLDSDDAGPCACDPLEPKERGVFRAIKKTYASFYNDNAFLERLRHGIDETQVGMGILAHVSTPDEQELANGVVTVSIDKSSGAAGRSYGMDLVTQAGAESVANPEGNGRPETVTVSGYSTNAPYLSIEQHSGLVPLGGTVLAWTADYQRLAGLIDQACQGYEALFPAKTRLWLDLEYKQITPGVLMLKQIRPVPQPDSTSKTTPFLLRATNIYVVYQGEHGDVFANHRLKSRWSLLARNMRLDSTNQCPIESLTTDYLEGTNALRFTGAVAELPAFKYRYQPGSDDTANNLLAWTWGEGSAARDYSLTMTLPTRVTLDQSPVIYLDDGVLMLKAVYKTPQPTINWEGAQTTLEDEVRLQPATLPGADSLRQQRDLADGALAVHTEFYWPPNPSGPTAGYTAPLQAWVQTTITGLASQPIQLAADAAQTYHPGHHNFSEEFLFDPGLDPAVPAAVKAELADQNIRALYISTGSGKPQFLSWGFDNQLREIQTGKGDGKTALSHP
jgi:hypothetical protein